MPDHEMSLSRLKDIQARCERAQQTPWTSWVEGRDHLAGSSFIMVGEQGENQVDIELSGATSDDQDFIAAARQDIPDLIAEVMRLRSLLGLEN